jgi:hypothetical protein
MWIGGLMLCMALAGVAFLVRFWLALHRDRIGHAGRLVRLQYEPHDLDPEGIPVLAVPKMCSNRSKGRLPLACSSPWTIRTEISEEAKCRMSSSCS